MATIDTTWPPRFPTSEWSEAAGMHVLDEVKKAAPNEKKKDAVSATMEHLTLRFHEISTSEPLSIVVGIQNPRDPDDFIQPEAEDIFRILNEVPNGLRIPLGQTLVWQYVMELVEKELGPCDTEVLDVEESFEVPELQNWRGERVRQIKMLEPDDPFFKKFLSRHPQLRENYEMLTSPKQS